METHVPLELLALDHMKAEPRRSSASDFLTMVDHYARFLVTTPLREIMARATTEAFWHYFAQPYGNPSAVITDQGMPFK